MATKIEPRGSNLTPETFLEHVKRVAQCKREMENKRGYYRDALKKAKADGVNQKQLIASMALLALDPGEVEMEFRDLGRYMAWMGRPIGAQAEMFAPSDDTMPSQKAAEGHSQAMAYEAGYRAGKAADSLDNSPHKPGDVNHAQWATGWHDGQAENAPLRDDKPATRGRKKKGGNPEDRPGA